MEKGGLTQTLQKAGVKTPQGLVWEDEMRVGLIGQVRRAWSPRGVKVIQPLEYTHDWCYLVLLVNPVRGTLRWTWTLNMKGVSLAPALRRWAQHGLRTVVWDRARGHGGPAYAGLKVKRIEQPPYSPELNPAERIFEYLRDKIEGIVYGSMEAKMVAVDKELQHLAAQPQQVKSLAGWIWILNALAAL